ncbi:DUF6879 family protein [Nonomuraea sp. NPDC050790]|uniref:DUF6879 family protein n=1 Tax=Nonomuraea sp. NPDC050790 TaxID=3364371 RepID=UPI0037A4339B
MRRLTDDERKAQFRQFTRSALHLELRDRYAVSEEDERFSRFLATGRRDLEADSRQRQWWLTLVRDATEAGKVIRRARVISEPVTDYIRFEWAGSGLTVQAGEEIRWLARHRASTIAFPGNDFWLFDDSTAMFHLFTGDGEWIAAELTQDPSVVQLCRSAFENVWRVAVPHHEYQPV